MTRSIEDRDRDAARRLIAKYGINARGIALENADRIARIPPPRHHDHALRILSQVERLMVNNKGGQS